VNALFSIMRGKSIYAQYMRQGRKFAANISRDLRLCARNGNRKKRIKNRSFSI